MRKKFFAPVHLAIFCYGAICVSQAIQSADFAVANRADVLVLTSKIQATQFLTHATFGPTQAEVDQLALEMRQNGTISAASAWIDRQVDQAQTPPGLHSDRQEAMITSDFPTYILYTRTGPQGNYVYTPTGVLPAFNNAVSTTRFRQHAWWHNVISGQDQLRQRTAWALAQVFAVNHNFTSFDEGTIETALTGGPSGKPRFFGISNYYDIFVKNAFGNYRDVVGRVTYHAVMGDWLSFRGNRRAQNGLFPDENYAREVMQLFTVGLDLLSDDGVPQTDANGTIPTYDNDDIREYAKIFTGLGYGYGTYDPTNTSLNRYSPYTGIVSTDPNATVKFQVPMRMASSQHDRGPKTLLNGLTIPDPDGDVAHSEESANNEIDIALDGLFSHQSCPPFVAHRLIQRMVKSNPSRAYIGRVVAAFKGSGPSTRGNLGNVVKAILLDPEAWQPIRVQYQRSPTPKFIVSTMGTEDSRLQEPVLNYTRFMRFFKANALYEKANANDYTTPTLIANEFRLNTRDAEFDQSPYEMPTVFNFYLAGHQPPQMDGYATSTRIPNGIIVAPEFEIANDLTSNRTGNFYRSIVNGSVRTETIQSFNPTTPTSSTQSNSGGVYTIVNESTRCRVRYDFTVEAGLSDVTGDVDKLIERLDLYLCGGTLSIQVKNRFRTAILNEISTAGGNGNVSGTEALAIARGTILALVTTPSFLVTE